MPLSTVCVSTVSGGPKAWSSYTNLPVKDVHPIRTMNSTEELSIYRETSKNSNVPSKKKAYFEYDFTDDKPAKKEKKWSIGNLFRRKKKCNDSSSEEDLKKPSSDKGRRKIEKRKKPVTFDHVVITQPQIVNAEVNTNCRLGNILSDNSKETKVTTNTYLEDASHTQPNYNEFTRHHPNQLSLDSVSRRSRKDLTKVRAEARRTSFNQSSSSDEGSQRSNSSHKLRSDESLSKLRDSSGNRRSRAARTERYLKRHSRDGENPNNYLKISKSDAESSFLRNDGMSSASESTPQFKLSYSSISSQSPSVLGLSTIPPSHTTHHRFKVSNSTSNPSYRSPLSMNEYNNTAKNSANELKNFNNQRSISFDADIHRPQVDSQVIHAKLELGKPRSRNLTFVGGSQTRDFYSYQQPPPPPPRDLRRLHQHIDNVNQNQGSYDHSPPQLFRTISNENYVLQNRKVNPLNMHSSFKSSSEDHIPRGSQIMLVRRPSSATPETDDTKNCNRIDNRSRSDNYQYLTDKQPRSRKPIFIQNGPKKSQSQREISNGNMLMSEYNETSAFLNQLKARKSNRKTGSPQIFTCETQVQTQIFLPSVLPENNFENVLHKSADVNEIEKNLDIVNRNTEIEMNEDTVQRKSSNLEEALNELEAIYNSLRLGDEDLLDMAEKREKEEVTRRMMEYNEHHPPWNSPRGTLSDSGFSYEPFDSLDASRRKRYFRKSLRSDDMAFRKINREDRAATINDPQNVTSKISYLLASPAYSSDQRLEQKTNPNEPDITLDDVVYRNIKQSNKSNVPEHPPPFGIPLGPITLAANSDYLHAVPDNEIMKPSKMPDLVKDDLAFRNLRKDKTKEPALPPVSTDDVKNNNYNNPMNAVTSTKNILEMRKNRAIRSKSANIGSLISQEVIERASRRNARDKNVEEFKTLTDIADAMEIARQVLREKEIKINETKRASMSDTDTGILKYTRYPVRNRKDHYKKGTSLNGLAVGNTDSMFGSNDNPKSFSPGLQDVERRQGSRSNVKEDTPIPISAFEGSELRPLFRTDSFEDALAALAIEAKEASDKFTRDLDEFDKKPLPKEDEQKIADELVNSEPVHLCKKLLEAVVDSTQHIAISQSKNKECEDINKAESIARLVVDEESLENEFIETDHDYENVDVNLGVNSGGKSGKKSPFEENKNQLVSTFKELRVDEIPLMEVTPSDSNDGEFCDELPGEPCVDVVESVALEPISECALNDPTKNSYFLSVDTNSKKPRDSDDESSGFHSQASYPEHIHTPSNDYSHNITSQGSKLDLSESLKSPRLVLETSKLNGSLGKYSSSLIEQCRNPSAVNTDRNCSGRRHIPDNFKSSGAWHNNPATLAIACSYGIACFHQLASIDLFAVMGIIFAILTFIAALLI